MHLRRTHPFAHTNHGPARTSLQVKSWKRSKVRFLCVLRSLRCSSTHMVVQRALQAHPKRPGASVTRLQSAASLQLRDKDREALGQVLFSCDHSFYCLDVLSTQARVTPSTCVRLICRTRARLQLPLTMIQLLQRLRPRLSLRLRLRASLFHLRHLRQRHHLCQHLLQQLPQHRHTRLPLVPPIRLLQRTRLSDQRRGLVCICVMRP